MRFEGRIPRSEIEMDQCYLFISSLYTRILQSCRFRCWHCTRDSCAHKKLCVYVSIPICKRQLNPNSNTNVNFDTNRICHRVAELMPAKQQNTKQFECVPPNGLSPSPITLIADNSHTYTYTTHNRTFFTLKINLNIFHGTLTLFVTRSDRIRYWLLFQSSGTVAVLARKDLNGNDDRMVRETFMVAQSPHHISNSNKLCIYFIQSFSYICVVA